MPTQMIEAGNGVITDEVRAVARLENIGVNLLRQKVALGSAVILKNSKKVGIVPVGIGDCLKVKVGACVGTYNKKSIIRNELDKVRVIEQAGADVLCDLSMGGYIDETREEILSATKLPLGTVPLYHVAKNALDMESDISKISKDSLLNEIEKQCLDGVDFITIHPGITKYLVDKLSSSQRLIPLSSKAGAVLASLIKTTGVENPLYEYFDELLEIVKQYDVVLSLGSALETAHVLDSCDSIQYLEITVLSELVKRARKEGVQTMIEISGHVSFDKIPSLIKNIKEMTYYAPIYANRIMPCDYAYGYEHITSAIGANYCAYSGADFIGCSLPLENTDAVSNSAQLKESIMCAKVAAHCTDLARYNNIAVDMDYNFSKAKIEFNKKEMMNNSIDKSIFDRIDIKKDKNPITLSDTNCASKLYKKYFE